MSAWTHRQLAGVLARVGAFGQTLGVSDELGRQHELSCTPVGSEVWWVGAPSRLGSCVCLGLDLDQRRLAVFSSDNRKRPTALTLLETHAIDDDFERRLYEVVSEATGLVVEALHPADAAGVLACKDVERRSVPLDRLREFAAWSAAEGDTAVLTSVELGVYAQRDDGWTVGIALDAPVAYAWVAPWPQGKIPERPPVVGRWVQDGWVGLADELSGERDTMTMAQRFDRLLSAAGPLCAPSPRVDQPRSKPSGK